MAFREHKILFPLSIFVAAILAAIFIWKSKPAPSQVPMIEPDAPKLTAMLAVAETRRPMIVSQGTVTPKVEIDLAALVAGRIEEVSDNFVSGGSFAANETLLQIDPRDYRIEVVRAASRVADAQQLLAQERGKARQAKREWRDLGNAEANELFLRKPQLAAAEAAVEAAVADHEKAEINLERTRVSVPFPGQVRSTSVNLGQYVGPGTALAKVFSSEILEIRLPLTNGQVGLLPGNTDVNKQHIPATVISEYGGQVTRRPAEIVRMEAALDTGSRVRYAVVEVGRHPQESQLPLMVGQFVTVEIEGREYDDVVALPVNALYQRHNVLMLDDQNQLFIRAVQVLQVVEDEALVRDVPAAAVVRLLSGQQMPGPGYADRTAG
ncbi:MAG: efflux RND transporter periplasmic adaptor subunit [Porticoccaceae bacterium]